MPTESDSKKSFSLTLDTWAVIVALALAVVVKLGLFTKVPW